MTKFLSFWQAFLLIAIAFILQLILMVFFHEIFSKKYGKILFDNFELLIVPLILVWKKTSIKEVFVKNKMDYTIVIFCLLLTLSLSTLILIVTFLNYSFTKGNSSLNYNIYNIQLETFLSSLLIGPVLEELFFRGIILRGFLIRYQLWAAISLSSLLFGLSHFVAGSEAIISALFGGVLLGYIYYTTRNLIFTTVCHIFHNACIIFIPVLLMHTKINSYEEITRRNTYIVVALIIIILIIFSIYKILYRNIMTK